MRIGIDFDNTIACYDELFHKVAQEKGLISEAVPVNKVAVRDSLRESGQERLWTELQGYVYGKRMDEALAYPGVLKFIIKMVDAGHLVNIVSHKTRHPVIGPPYDLQKAASQWIEDHLVRDDNQPVLTKGQIFFEQTREEKLARIESCGCDVFIDDLPEVLTTPGFSQHTQPILFDPEAHHAMTDIPTFSSWSAILQFIGKGL